MHFSHRNFSKEAFKFNEKIWAIRKSATVMVSPEEMKEAVEAVKAHDKIWAQVSIFLSENDPLWKQCSISIPETPMPANEWGNLCKKWHKSLQQTLKQTKTSAKEKLRSALACNILIIGANEICSFCFLVQSQLRTKTKCSHHAIQDLLTAKN